jgi:hypothetical protein
MASSAIHDLVERAAQLDKQDFERFLSGVFSARAKQHKQSLGKTESDLLKKINAGFPAAQWAQMKALSAKLHDHSILPEEQRLLEALLEDYERFGLQRLKYIAKLAAVRQVSLREMMEQLGVRHHG